MTADPTEPSTTGGGHPGPSVGTERALAEILADLIQVERVPVDGHFFDDLGADSMVMAQFCALAR